MKRTVFERVKRLGVAEQVVGAIREAIVGGRYREGDSLPSERELATQFGVNRSSIREALLRLEAWGLVHIKQGGATRVRDVFYSAGLQILPYLIAPNGELNESLLDDILSVRVMFLSWTAEQAAERGTPDEVAELEQALERLRSATRADAIQEADFEFFERLVAMSKNRVLALFTNALRDIYQRNAPHLLFLYPEVPFDVRYHARALKAVAAGDGTRAAKAMRQFGDLALEAHRARRN